MEKDMKLEAKDFSNLLRCLSILKGICNDLDIRGGVLRQRSTDKSSIFEMDLRPLISDCDIPLSDLESNLNLLKGLSKQGVQITVTDDKTYFSGKHSTFDFKNPRQDFMDNKFISNEEFLTIFTLREEDLVLEYMVTKDISNVMKLTAGQFKIVSFQIRFHGDTASITAAPSGKKQHVEIEYGIPVKKPFKGFSNVVNTPFLLDRDKNILFKMYNVQEDIFISKFTSSIGKIAVDIYSRSQLMEDEEGSTSLEEEGGE